MKFKEMLESGKKFIKKRDNLIVLVLTGILLLVIAWPVSGTENKKNNMTGLWDRNNGNIEQNSYYESEYIKESDVGVQNYEMDETDIWRQETYLEEKLETFLGSIYGVGNVKVMLRLEDYGEKIVEKDIPLERSNVAEKDSTGGSRDTSEMNTQETTVYITNANGEKLPYVMKEKSPVVRGVTVVAQGGDNATVQKNISDVIQALFGIEAHKIIVVKMKQEE